MSTGTRLAEIWTRTMRPDETRARTPAGTRAMTSGIPSPPRLRTPLLLALLAAIVSLATLHGCEDVQVTAVEVASVTVSPSQATLLPGETVQLTATPQGASGNLLGDRPVTWRSDDTSLAKVSSSGVVEGLTPGQTVIRASAGDAEGTATITVGAPPRIAISPAQITLHAVAGDDGSQAESVAITNDGAGTLSGLTTTVTYPSGEPQGWLDASLDGSQAPATLTLQASPAQLAEGTYQAQVEVGSEAADNSPRVVEVELEVGAAPARIALSTSSVGFVWEEGQSPPAAQPVGVTNEGGGNLTGLALSVAYVEEGNPEWLSAELEDTTAPTEISLQVHPGSLGTGMYNATVEVRSPAADNSAQELRVRLTVGAPPPEIELIPDAVQWSTNEGESPSGRAVQVQNQGSGELGDLAASVSYAAGESTGWLSAQLNGTTAPTTLQLSVQADDLLPGTYSATVDLTSPDAVNSPQLVAATLQVNASVDPEQSEINAAPGVLPADGVATSTITVRLRDLQGDPMSTGGADVQLSTTRGTLSSVSDRGDGTYTATLRAPTSVGEGVVTGTVNGSVIADNAVVRFVPGEASPATSTITADPRSLPADGSSTSTLTVQLRDAHGNHLTEGGHEVTLALEGAGSLGGVTDRSDGTYTATYTAGSEVGSAVITGRLDGQTMDDQAVVTLGTGDVSPETSQVEANPHTDVTADGSTASEVTVQLRDSGNNPIGGLGNADFDIALTDGQGGGTDASHSTVTETSTAGTYTFDVTNTTAEVVTVIVTARSTTLNDQPTIQFVAGDAEPTLTIVSGNRQEGTVGEALDDALVVRVTDGQGDPVSGVAVTWDPDDGSANPTASTTGTNGQASTTWTLGDEVGEQTLTASADGVGDPVRFTATAQAGGISASTSDVKADPDSDVTADGSTASEVTVELRDSEDNPIGGLGNADFDIALTDGDGRSTDASHSTVTETSTAGTYTFDVTNTTAEEVTVIVTARSTTIDAQPTIQFVAGQPTSLIIQSGNGQEGAVGQELDDPLVVEVTDGQGNPVRGVRVTWDPDDDGSADPTASTTGTNGRASTTWTLGDEVGEQTLTASADGVGESVTFTATAGRGDISASESSVEADPDSDVLADGEEASTVTVELRNAEDYPLGGIPPGHFKTTLTVNGTESTTAKRTPVRETSTAGTYTFRVRNSAAEEVTVTVTADGTTLDDRPTIEFVEEGGQ